MKDKWSDKYPTEVGWYWCFGNYLGNKTQNEWAEKLHMIPVQVRKISNGFVYIGHGTMLYASEWKGYWIKAEVPTPCDFDHNGECLKCDEPLEGCPLNK
jgi:hypothetical protein